MSLRVMTWNISQWKNFKKIIDFVKDNNIEIMGFQEVDKNLKRTNYLDIAKKIAHSLHYYYRYCPSIEKQETGKLIWGKFGNCIISKFPIIESKRHFLTSFKNYGGTRTTEPRTLLEVKIKIKERVISFMTLHLSYARKFETTLDKNEQIERVIKIIQNNKNYPIILTWDFNSLPQNQEIQKVKQFLEDIDDNNLLKTWTMYDFEYEGWKVSAWPQFKIDYIFISKNMSYKNPRVDKNYISDHLPLFVDLEFME